MTMEHFPKELLTQTLEVLATEIPALASDLVSMLNQATVATDQNGFSLRVGDHMVASRSRHGVLTFFQPPGLTNGQRRRLASFDRNGRLLLLLYWTPEGKLTHYKVRGLDGRFLGIVRGAASHLGWGESDCVWL